MAMITAGEAQNLLTNGKFESGTGHPQGWKLQAGKGEWSRDAGTGDRVLAMTGNGNDQGFWQSDPVGLARNQLYRLSFRACRGAKATGGSATAGPGQVNRDFQLDDSWRAYSFVFSQPSDADTNSIRPGQWQIKGEARFADVELVPVMAVNPRFEKGLELGEGERIHHGVYQCQIDLNGEGSDYHRTLVTNRAGFNSNRWLFQSGASVVYRHALAGFQQKEASIRVAINYYTGGSLNIEASRDGHNWATINTLSQKEPGAVVKPPQDWFPTPEIWVRLAHAGKEGQIQVNTYSYEAPLAGAAPEAVGSTYFIDVLHQNAELPVLIQHVNAPDGAGRGLVLGELINHTPKAMQLQAAVIEPNTQARFEGKTIQVSPRTPAILALPYKIDRAGLHPRLVVLKKNDGTLVFQGRFNLKLGFLNDPGFGHRLSGPKSLGVWWCESGWKVGRDRGLPSAKSGEVLMVTASAARGEYEAVQVVLRSEQSASLLSARLSPLKNSTSGEAPITASLYEVAYVPVRHPTDTTGYSDAFPDPLPPLQCPLALLGGKNQPLWLSFYVAPETAPGRYTGQLELVTSAGLARVPVQVQVYSFTMPKETHLHSALGLGAQGINRYHHLADQVQKESVYDKYLENFAQHRISPYSFFPYAPIQVQFTGEGAQKRAQLDFSRFDAAAEKWLGSGRFNSFKLPLRGMGGGTFHSRHLGELEGFTEGTPEHARLFRDYLSQIEAHLRQKGWLDKAYTYWFDEPAPKDYEFVAAGMKRLKEAAPGIKRLLTVQPEPQLQGQVEIWCGLTPQWSKPKVEERRKLGESVWWYICTGPKAPYVTEFIDHPGTELRLWPWQSWQYGVEGILIWETVYWNSDLVYPSPKLQNPWTDPMSYVTGYGNPVGFVGYWGNGDGRFLYPPRRDPEKEITPCLDAPINSIRWENLRDGMEDYEYFWMLEKAIQQAQASLAKAKLLPEAKQLLEVPPEISQDLTHFTTDPRLLLKHRERIARMIERLGGGVR